VCILRKTRHVTTRDRCRKPSQTSSAQTDRARNLRHSECYRRSGPAPLRWTRRPARAASIRHARNTNAHYNCLRADIEQYRRPNGYFLRPVQKIWHLLAGSTEPADFARV
jgi:hypothetical protein